MTAEIDSPLWDLEAEQAVLGVCMSAPYIVGHIRAVLPDPEAFHRPSHRTIYAALLELADAEAPTDTIAVKHHLERAGTLQHIGGTIKGPLYLHELMAVAPIAGDPAYHATIIARHAMARRAIQALHRGLQWVGNTAQEDVHGALSAVQEEIGKALGDIAGTATSTTNALANLYQPLDWQTVFAAVPEDVPWLVEPLIEAGRSIAIYSPPKAGKSLLTLEIAAALAAGRPVLGRPASPPVKVMYIDIENTSADVTERLTNLGYGPADLGNLIYYSFPSLPVLDSASGGQHLMALAKHHQPTLVVIDTVSRVIEGSENDADTFANLYRHALAPLKGMGIAVVRLDHSGKDLEKGQRGSSAKNADVDAVWLLVKASETSLYLKREMSRANHGVPLIEMRRRAAPLRHELVAAGNGLPPKVAQLIEFMEQLEIPRDAGRDTVREELAASGIKASNETISAAISARKAGM